MKKKNKNISKFFIVTLLVIGLLVTLSLTVFANGFDKKGGFGKDRIELVVKINASDWKEFYYSLKSYVDSVKRLIDSQVDAGIISKYCGEALKNKLDEIFKQINKTRTIKLMPGFGYGNINMAYFKKRALVKIYKNLAKSYKGKGKKENYNAENYNANYRGFINVQITDSQWNKILPLLKDVEKKKQSFYKTMLNIGLITEVQYKNMLKVSDKTYNYMIKNKLVKPLYGINLVLRMVK